MPLFNARAYVYALPHTHFLTAMPLDQPQSCDFAGSSAQLRPECIFPCEGRSMHINPAIQQHLITLLTAFLLPFNPHACMLWGLCTSIWPTMESNVFMPTSCGHGVDSITTASAFEIRMRILERCIRRLVLARLCIATGRSPKVQAGLNSACRQRRRQKGFVLSHATQQRNRRYFGQLYKLTITVAYSAKYDLISCTLRQHLDNKRETSIIAYESKS